MKESEMTPIRKTLALLGVLAGIATGTAAHADSLTTLFNTGVNDKGAVLADGSVDTHYTLISGPAGSSSTSSTSWHGPVSAQVSVALAPVGQYDWRTTFDLTGFDTSSVSLSGRFNIFGDTGSLLLNGAVVENGVRNDWTAVSLSSGFVSGLNTLDFVINGSSNLLVEVAGTGTPTDVPEPATLALLGAGALGLFATRRRVFIA